MTLPGHAIAVRGSKGELSRSLHPDMQLRLEGATVIVTRPSDAKRHRSLHGLTRTLVANMIEGVSRGYEKQLELVGVGYRAARQGDALVVNVGYSHPVRFAIPAGIQVDVPEPTKIVVRGADKEVVGQVAAEIRKIRPPEPYKGKGILHKGERIRRKAGKTGKATGSEPGAK